MCGCATVDCKSLLARFAATEDVPMLSDVVRMIDKKTFQRPIYAGNAVETLQVITLLSSHPDHRETAHPHRALLRTHHAVSRGEQPSRRLPPGGLPAFFLSRRSLQTRATRSCRRRIMI